MGNPERSLIFKIYRNKYVPLFLSALLIIGGGILGLTRDTINQEPNDSGLPLMPAYYAFLTAFAFNAAMFIAVMTARIHYQLRPQCKTCGKDAVDCKIARNSFLPHARPRT